MQPKKKEEIITKGKAQRSPAYITETRKSNYKEQE